VFAKLKGLGPAEGSRKFVQLSIHLNHWPFKAPIRYPGSLAFPGATHPRERYLNSVRQQDHCVGVFMEEFKNLGWPNTHLFVVGDHSMPVGRRGLFSNGPGHYDEDFLVPLLYIPPESRRREFRVGTQNFDLVPSQTDLIPTIFDLLNGRPEKQSFAPAMRLPSPGMAYEPCQVMIQPFHGEKIIVARGDRKWVYLVQEEKVMEYPFPDPPEGDLVPLSVTSRVSYATFRKSYLCERFRN
jgi:hypothetical protein